MLKGMEKKETMACREQRKIDNGQIIKCVFLYDMLVSGGQYG